MSGKLYVCATPIGNLEDITYRVVKTLKEADLIAAEDTRHSRILLEHFSIGVPCTSYHEHNKYEKAEVLIEKMKAGQQVALISDAGTPAISDPGEVLVRRCLEEGIPVSSLPGACACITALTMSGLSTRRFAFEAFLPADKRERQEILAELAEETRTIVLYEAPHHLLKTLGQLYEALGDRQIAVCRELTKKYEENIRMSLSETIAYYQEKEPRGEYVLVIEGRSREEIKRKKQEEYREMSIEDHLNSYLASGMEKKEAMKAVARDRGCTRREVYRMLLEAEE